MKKTIPPRLVEIDLSKTTKAGGAGLRVGPVYLILHSGQFHTGTFSKQWYGLNFNGMYDAGCQYDPPGENYSGWQRIWRFDNAKEIADSLEMEYATMRREYAIAHMSGGRDRYGHPRRIDDSTPIEAYLYHPTKPTMPREEHEEDEYDEEDC